MILDFLLWGLVLAALIFCGLYAHFKYFQRAKRTTFAHFVTQKDVTEDETNVESEELKQH
ncbi:MAG: hypothetical protein LBT89_06190 [Planctomycetaceae bacterium]|jgi:hypothetical protein|nr:hypothetical protein [Planctomycetaceae bacterium]